MGKLLKGQIFSSEAEFFCQTGWKSLPRVGNTGCALCVQWGGGGEHLPSRFCLSTVYILRQESVIKYVAVFKVITGSNLCLLTALCFLRMLLWAVCQCSCGPRHSSQLFLPRSFRCGMYYLIYTCTYMYASVDAYMYLCTFFVQSPT